MIRWCKACGEKLDSRDVHWRFFKLRVCDVDCYEHFHFKRGLRICFGGLIAFVLLCWALS